jgi:nucleoid DNA-binding protein
MRKAEIVDRVAEALNLSHLQAQETIEAVLDEIKETLQRGERVMLRRFGSFDVRAKDARMGRNPKTSEAAPIAARRVVRFKAGP